MPGNRKTGMIETRRRRRTTEGCHCYRKFKWNRVYLLYLFIFFFLLLVFSFSIKLSVCIGFTSSILCTSSDVEISDVTVVLFLLSLFEVIFLYIEYSSAEGGVFSFELLFRFFY
jgi:hypothetical protein